MRLQAAIKRAAVSPHWRHLRRVNVWLVAFVLITALAPRPLAQEKKRVTQGPKPDALVTPSEAAELEAVITTNLGEIRFEFFPDKAPRHVQHFIKWAREGFYDGSAFFRMYAYATIQGGDPNLKDPA